MPLRIVRRSVVALLLGGSMLAPTVTPTIAATIASTTAPTIVAGTSIALRLSTQVGSDARFAGALITAIVIAPVSADGRLAIAPGAPLWGRVTRTGRDAQSRHLLQLTFDSIDTGVQRVRIALRITAVENARERVDSAGLIVGAPATSAVRSREDWILMSLGAFHPVAAAALFAESRVQSRERARPIQYAVGTDLTAQLTRALTLADWTHDRSPPPVGDPAALPSLVDRWPLRASAFAGRAQADLLNIAIMGDSATVTNAFVAAGWDIPERMSVHANFETFVKAAEGRGYLHQPVSQLLLDGRPPSLLFQKVNNTFAKRHHVRLWRWSPTGAGASSLYLAGATHDVGVEFLTDRKQFTHQVDPAIDAERDKIVNDLWTAGCLAGMSYVPRRTPDGVTVNDGRDAVTTDGFIALLRLRSACATTSR